VRRSVLIRDEMLPSVATLILLFLVVTNSFRTIWSFSLLLFLVVTNSFRTIWSFSFAVALDALELEDLFLLV